MSYHIVEKKNRHALHAICSTKESAERYIKETVPMHVAKGYYTDKTLKVNSFKIVKGKY